MKVEVAVPGSPSLIGPYGLCGRKATLNLLRAQELCESRGGRPGLPVPCKPDGFRGRKVIVQELCESRGGRPGLSVPTSLLVSVDVKLY